MTWRVDFRPQVEQDVSEAAAWYESRQPGLGTAFVENVIQVWQSLAANPLLNSRKHPSKNLRWRYPDRFPYRIVYEVNEANRTVLVVAVLHAARHDGHWQSRARG